VAQWRDKYKQANDRCKSEIELRDEIANKLNAEIEDLKEELLMAKRILRDPQLSQLASRKFHDSINKNNETKFLADGTVLTELLE